jgi:hypothetical protein
VADLDLSELNLDGSHTIAKKGAFGQVSRPKTG